MCSLRVYRVIVPKARIKPKELNLGSIVNFAVTQVCIVYNIKCL